MSALAPAPQALSPNPRIPDHQDLDPLGLAPQAKAPQRHSSRLGSKLELSPAVAPRPARIPLSAWLLLLLTASLSSTWSSAKLLSQDEIFVLQTDSVGSLRQLLSVQRHTPLSLDPLVYHLAGFFSLHLFHPQTPAAQACALRLPSLAGFVLMQLCLYLFVRKFLLHTETSAPAGTETAAITAQRAGLLALTLPALSATFFYSAEARPYGLLLGLSGLILVAWQAASREAATPDGRSAPSSRRAGSLSLLAISLALALNTHYFAILLILPLAGAEFHRLGMRRKFDFPMLLALGAGSSSVLLSLPFQHAAGEFRTHYYNVNSVNGHALTQAFRSLLIDYTAFTLPTQRAVAILLFFTGMVFLTALLHRWIAQPGFRRSPEITFLFTLAALPFAGFLLGRFATHSFEVRYVVCALPALCALLVILLAPHVTRHHFSAAALALVAVLVSACGAWRIHAEHLRTRDYLASLELSPAVRNALAQTPDGRLYMQNLGQFEPAQLYLRDPVVRSRLTLLFSREAELHWDLHDTASLTAKHLQHFTTVPTLSWAEFTRQPGPHVLILFHSGWDWTDQALAASGAELVPLGPAMGGDAVLVASKP